MKYDHLVKHDGVFYLAGTEVPIKVEKKESDGHEAEVKEETCEEKVEEEIGEEACEASAAGKPAEKASKQTGAKK